MKVIRCEKKENNYILENASDLSTSNETVVTVGVFDGVHLGHKEVINKLIRVAKKKKLISVVVTFEPHPRSILSQDSSFKTLSSLSEKMKNFDNLNVEIVVFLKFSKNLSNEDPKDFVENFLVKVLNMKHLISGYDHSFGKNREGTIDFLQKELSRKNIGFSVVGKQTQKNSRISSSEIRREITKGNIEKANELLGRNYEFRGIVVQGEKRGRRIGFPTANIECVDKHKCLPSIGVYLVKVEYQSTLFWGMMNLGYRPTFEKNNEMLVEVYLLDFDRNLYGKSLTIQCLKRIRDEKIFSGINELKKQLKEDERVARSIINC